MSKFINITGQKYGKLTVIKYLNKTKYEEKWLCECDCGKEVIRNKSTLRKGLSTSCGCERYKKSSQSNKKQNKYNLTGDYGVGYTTKGEEFYFDLEDYDKIKNICWYIGNNGYVCSKTKNKMTLFHRIIMNPLENMDIDHINHQKQDNRKLNLRIATRSQNLVNRYYPNSTGYRGVLKLPSGNYIAQIGNEYLGIFNNPIDANEKYLEIAKKIYGDFLPTEKIYPKSRKTL